MIEQLRRMSAEFEHIDMRYFRNSQSDPTTLSLDELESSDIYLGIVGHRYGTLSADGYTSITRAEYDRAHSMNKRLIIYETGQKVQEIREAPAACLLLDAYRRLEHATMSAEVLRVKQGMEPV